MTFYINFHLNDRLEMEFTGGSTDIVTVCVTHIASLLVKHSYRRQKVGHEQNI